MSRPNTKCHDGQLIEQICRFRLPVPRLNEFLESQDNELPKVIYTEFRTITLNKVTLNKTRYKEEYWQKSKSGSGLLSFTRPYGIPVIADHNTYDVSNTYGRVDRPAKIVKDANETYIVTVAAITHPAAIEHVMTGRWSTTSLGSRAESVFCSICGNNLAEEWCDHWKGEKYKVDGKMVECVWDIGPAWAKEQSFVITPSDTQAGVLNPNLEEGYEQEAAGRLARLIVPNRNGVFDLVSNTKLSESVRPEQFRRPPAAVGNFQFLGY